MCVCVCVCVMDYTVAMARPIHFTSSRSSGTLPGPYIVGFCFLFFVFLRTCPSYSTTLLFVYCIVYSHTHKPSLVNTYVDLWLIKCSSFTGRGKKQNERVLSMRIYANLGTFGTHPVRSAGGKTVKLNMHLQAV